jgi:hypothetical protein
VIVDVPFPSVSDRPPVTLPASTVSDPLRLSVRALPLAPLERVTTLPLAITASSAPSGTSPWLQFAASFQSFGFSSEPPMNVFVPLIEVAEAGAATASRTAATAMSVVRSLFVAWDTPRT